MPPIVKSPGTTDSERFLATIAERSFLSLWSYPNVYRGPAKELCDLLVVCGNKIIVFSDKSISWPSHPDLNVSWGRWYRKAIEHSAKQLKRAIGWIKNHPDRIFLDPKCQQLFPIEIPTDDLEIHGVIVARGASAACRAHLGGSGSLALSPRDIGDGVPTFPFFVGNPSPDPEAVYHIFDDVTLSVLLLELDTITDLTRYLDRKSTLLMNGHLVGAHGEEDLLAVYLKDLGPDGDHDFVISPRKALKPGEMLLIEGGTYEELRNRDEYKRKKRADQISYLWDHLIERFAKVILEDTAYVVRGYEGVHEPSKRELGLRYMALAHRLERRSNSEAIKGAFDRLGTADRFFRAMLPGPTDKSGTGFFILLLRRGGMLSDVEDEEYRIFRTSLMQIYALNLLRLQRSLKRVVGIATEGELDRSMRSEDLIYAEQPDWTPEYEHEIEQAGKGLGIFKGGIPKGKNARRVRPLEYPPSHHKKARGRNPIAYSYEHDYDAPMGNRAARRAELARRRKSRR